MKIHLLYNVKSNQLEESYYISERLLEKFKKYSHHDWWAKYYEYVGEL